MMFLLLGCFAGIITNTSKFLMCESAARKGLAQGGRQGIGREEFLFFN